ncbi:hypothetical protein MHU86_25870 [Fragilaria crotonensis]|nr:hypothetical protein MHU86_25870 [Fragilaria crotonensis]
MSFPQPYDDTLRGSKKSRGRERQGAVTTTPRRSRSAEASRPQYKDSRRVQTNRSRNPLEIQAIYSSHQMSLFEPTFHDVDESRMKHSRSLSPAFPRRLTATPYDPFLIESRNRDLYQRYAEEAYSQRYANSQEMTSSLLMFSDALEPGSALTGWSEQELIQKKKKKNEAKKEKSYGKKKKNREPRILNMPLARKRNINYAPSELPVVAEKKRYYRGADGPNGAMTREVIGKQAAPIAKPESPSRKRSWINPALARSSDVESTQSSSESPEGVSNAAARRWLQTKEKRKQKSDFPLLSTKSSTLATFGRDAPGPVARRPSPVMPFSTPNRDGAPAEPIEQLRLSSDEKHQHLSQPEAVSSFENDWMQSDADMNTTPDFEDSHRFSSYMGTGFSKTFDMPDDGSPTSVIPSQTAKKVPFVQQPSKGSEKPKSILRNSPRSPSRRVDGTHPLSERRKQLHETGIGIRPRKVQTRFSDSVEQRTYDNKVEAYNSDDEDGSNYFNDYTDQGAFPVQHKDQSTDVYDRYELEKMVEELLGGSRNQQSTDEGSKAGKDQNKEISISQPSENANVQSPLSPLHQQPTSESHLNRAVEDVTISTLSHKPHSRRAEKSGDGKLIVSKEAAVADVVQDKTPLPTFNESDLHKTTAASASSSSDMGEPWIDDEDFTIGDDEFDSPDEMAFMQVVAAVVIQTTVRRFLAILSFERRIAAHFKDIVGSDLVEPSAPPLDKDTRSIRPVNDNATHPISRSLLRPAPSQNERERIHRFVLAAITIQRVFRGWWVRDSLHVDHYCASLVQRMVRGFLARTNFYYDMYRIVLVQAYVRMILAREQAAGRLAFVVLIQSHIRGFLKRKQMRGLLPQRNGPLARYVAAVKMQALCRSYLAHERYLNTLADVLIVQSIARRWIVNVLVVPQLKNKTSGSVAIQDRAGRSTGGIWRKKANVMRPPRGPTEYRTDSTLSAHEQQQRAASGAKMMSTTAKARFTIESRKHQFGATGSDSMPSLDWRPGSDDPLSPLEATPKRDAGAVILATPSDEGSVVYPSPRVNRSMAQRAVAASPRNFSFDEPSVPMQYRPSVSLSFEESPKPYRSAVNAAREALQGSKGIGGMQIESERNPSTPHGASPRRKVPQNSAASFWEQKTASQPKPMFPPKGWR